MKKLATAILVLLMGATVAMSVQKPGEWIKYTSPEGRYSVMLPAQPTLGTQESATADGTKVTHYRATVAEVNRLYLIGYFHHAPGTTYSFDNARDGMVAVVKGTLISESVISLAGYPGRELKISGKGREGTELLIRLRLYDVDNRVYILQFIIPELEESSTNAENSVKFFDSFQVTRTQ